MDKTKSSEGAWSKFVKRRIINTRTAHAAGSALAIWPTGNYSQYMPQGSEQERISQHWISVGKYLRSSLNRHAVGPLSTR